MYIGASNFDGKLGQHRLISTICSGNFLPPRQDGATGNTPAGP